MAQFSVNATRHDPYKNFKFRVKWDGRYVAGVSKVSAMKRTTDMVEHREGGDERNRGNSNFTWRKRTARDSRDRNRSQRIPSRQRKDQEGQWQVVE